MLTVAGSVKDYAICKGDPSKTEGNTIYGVMGQARPVNLAGKPQFKVCEQKASPPQPVMRDR